MENNKQTLTEDETAAPILSVVCPVDPWHSTPIKKNHPDASFKNSPAQPTAGKQATGRATSIFHTSPDCTQVLGFRKPQEEDIVNIITKSTVERQRRELQLLLSELKDRDKELNDMVNSHKKQLLAWEEDRQRVLTLELKCSSQESELQKRNTVIEALSKRLRIMEAQKQDSQLALGSSQQELLHLGQRQQHFESQCQELQERNQTLNTTVLKLSSQVGQLQAQEEELKALLKLKDTDLTEATNCILELTNRFHKLEALLEECRSWEGKAVKETEEHRRSYMEAINETLHLKEELKEKMMENDTQKEELVQLRQENKILRSELSLLGEELHRKEELLKLVHSKKERTELECRCLRQICENQQNDLQLLELNLECTQEALRQREGVGSSVQCVKMNGAARLDTGVSCSSADRMLDEPHVLMAGLDRKNWHSRTYDSTHFQNGTRHSQNSESSDGQKRPTVNGTKPSFCTRKTQGEQSLLIKLECPGSSIENHGSQNDSVSTGTLHLKHCSP
ncbi:coiled-coil domain-containing protein 62 isoform X2 [Arapaima gigas]